MKLQKLFKQYYRGGKYEVLLELSAYLTAHYSHFAFEDKCGGGVIICSRGYDKVPYTPFTFDGLIVVDKNEVDWIYKWRYVGKEPCRW